MAQQVKLSRLKFKPAIYSRVHDDEQSINDIARAYQSGITVPPIIVDKKTMICVVGRRRVLAAEKLGYTSLPADVRVFKDKEEMLELSMVTNQHGKPLSSYDKANCVILADRLGMSTKRLELALMTTHEYVIQLRQQKIGRDTKGNIIPLKTVMRHMSAARLNQRVTAAQQAGHLKATGECQTVYVEQVINLFTYHMLDYGNQKLLDKLLELKHLLDNLFGTSGKVKKAKKPKKAKKKAAKRP